jgi:hypothetical protein
MYGLCVGLRRDLENLEEKNLHSINRNLFKSNMPPKKNLPRISTDFKVPDPNRMPTREENKGREVGKPDVKKKRATKAEMLARKAAKAKENADNDELHLQAIQNIVAIEVLQQEKENGDANRPKGKDIARVPRAISKSLASQGKSISNNYVDANNVTYNLWRRRSLHRKQ